MNTPPAKAGGFRLRLKAGLIGTSADGCRYTTTKSSSGSGGVCSLYILSTHHPLHFHWILPNILCLLCCSQYLFRSFGILRVIHTNFYPSNIELLLIPIKKKVGGLHIPYQGLKINNFSDHQIPLVSIMLFVRNFVISNCLNSLWSTNKSITSVFWGTFSIVPL